VPDVQPVALARAQAHRGKEQFGLIAPLPEERVRLTGDGHARPAKEGFGQFHALSLGLFPEHGDVLHAAHHKSRAGAHPGQVHARLTRLMEARPRGDRDGHELGDAETQSGGRRDALGREDADALDALFCGRHLDHDVGCQGVEAPGLVEHGGEVGEHARIHLGAHLAAPPSVCPVDGLEDLSATTAGLCVHPPEERTGIPYTAGLRSRVGIPRFGIRLHGLPDEGRVGGGATQQARRGMAGVPEAVQVRCAHLGVWCPGDRRLTPGWIDEGGRIPPDLGALGEGSEPLYGRGTRQHGLPSSVMSSLVGSERWSAFRGARARRPPRSTCTW